MIYIDTSILAAYYCPEPLSFRAERALREAGERAVSWLVEVELASVLARKVRAREMQLVDARHLHTLFQSHLEQGAYSRLRLDSLHFAKAAEWLATFTLPLHTLDALHLAVAAIEDCTLLTADAVLAKACAKVGIMARLIS